jgi:hypothetical protein
MQTLRDWALTVALSALAGGIVWLLTPRGSVQKAVRTVVAVFLLCAFLSPVFTHAGKPLDWVLPQAVDEVPTILGFDETISKQMQAAVEAELCRRIEQVLEAHGLDLGKTKIIVLTHILSDGSIEIVTAKAAVPVGTDITELKAELKAQTELDVEVEGQ